MKDLLLIIGSEGYLGSYITPFLKKKYDVITVSKSNKKADLVLDISSFNKTEILFNKLKPKVILNLSGLTSVEECEAEPHLAYLANVKTVESLVNWIRNNKSYLIHISTDHLYDLPGPHNEKKITLTNTYALTKYLGERAALNVKSSILRTNFIGKSKNGLKNNMTDWLYHALINKINIKVLNDVLFSPLHLSTLSEMIDRVIKKKPIGIYNLGSKKGMSKAQFDFKFADMLCLSTKKVNEISIRNASFFKVNRPRDMRLNSRKFENVFKIKLPSLETELAKAVNDYKK